MKKRLIIITTIATGALMLGSAVPASAAVPSHYGPPAPSGSIVDVVVAASGGGTPDNNPYDYDLLVQALTVTGLVPVLADTSRKLGPISVLTAGSITMANGGIVRPCGLTLRDQNPAFPDPWLVLSGLNIQASNGVIHTINRVLLPAVL